ncbi:hypothetical protein [Caballeronia sp. M23-90]
MSARTNIRLRPGFGALERICILLWRIYDSLQPLAANIAVAESAASAQAVKH